MTTTTDNLVALYRDVAMDNPHLEPFVFRFGDIPDATVSRMTLDHIAKLHGIARDLIRLADTTADYTVVETCDRIGGEWHPIGRVEFLPESEVESTS